MHCLATYLDTRLLSAAGELGENTTSFTGRHFVKFGDKMRREDKNSLALIQVNAVSKKLSPTTDHFYGQEENVSYLLDMFTRTVDKGESNSLLVLGPRGVGKSALVTHVLRSVQDHHVTIVIYLL